MRLAHDIYLPLEKENEEKSPIVLLHGRLDSKKTWKKLAPRLSQLTGRKVFAVDLRNHGESPWSDQMDFDVLCDDIEDFMGELGISRAILIGHSMGGRTAITLALRKPNKVEKLIVEDMAVEGYSSRVKNTVGQLIQLMRKSLGAIPPHCDDVTARKAVYDYVKSVLQPRTTGGFMFDEDTLSLKRRGSGYTWQANLDVLEDMLKNRTSPPLSGCYDGQALFLYGSKSFIEVEKDESIGKYFPNARKVRVEGVGHLIHQDEPDVFMEEILKFI